jgi:glycosyltransferase involved in cell wall biosynthesis
MNDATGGIELSVIVPVGARQADPLELYREYRSGLDSTGQAYELIFVLDGPRKKFADGLRALLDRGEHFTVVGLSRAFGEATAIMAGFEHASAPTIVTLPAYHQIEGSEIAKLVDAIGTCDLAVGRRWPRAGGWFERLRRSAFHGLLAWVTGRRYKDLGCGARAFDRRVLDEVHLYGDQHRFLAVLAERQGFKVTEVDLKQSPSDRFQGVYGPREYARSFLDLFTVFFLARFTKKPLRFFGMIGVATSLVGGILVTWLVAEKLLFGQALASRPALLLSSLLVVLGLQLFALGLLGELIIFTHAKQIKDYQVERIIQFSNSRGGT